MESTDKTRPLVRRGAHQLQTYDMDAKCTGGAKNPDRVMTSMTTSYKIPLKIGQINSRTLSQDHQVDYLIQQQDKMQINILCINETRRKEEVQANWHTGHQVFLSSYNDNKVGGVGFIVDPHWKNKIISCKMAPRHASLVIRIHKKSTLKVISCYSPTSTASDDEIEVFYQHLEEHLYPKNTFTVIAGDLNAKVGQKVNNEKYIGQHGSSSRNERGDRLATFAETNRLYVMNTFFKKRQGRRWTWISPNNEVKNEIDYFISNNRRIFQDVSSIGLSSFDILSDHRLILAKININIKKETKIKQTTAQRFSQVQLDEKLFSKKCSETNWSITSDSIDDDYEEFTTKLNNIKKECTTPNQENKRTRLKPDTLSLLKKRRELKIDDLEYKIVAKELRRRMKEDYANHRSERLARAAETKRSLKKVERKVNLKTPIPTNFIDEQGNTLSNRNQMEDHVKDFYNSLFKSQKSIHPPNINKVQVPNFLKDEVTNAIKLTKAEKSPGIDNITAEDLKLSTDSIAAPLAQRFSWYLEQGKIPTQWKTSKTILIFKKGALNEIKNYRPICLLSTIYKIFTNLILQRIKGTLNQECSREQAGFRKSYSTIDHIHSIRQIIQKHHEHKIPLYLLYIDFEKAFDSVEHNAILNALKTQGIPDQYIQVIKEINNQTTTSIKLFHRPIEINIERGVRQGDVISPNLFTSTLEHLIRQIDFNQNEGINIDGEKLRYLAFADDIVLMTNDPRSIESMLQKLNNEADKVGLKIHTGKTQWMTNQKTNQTIKLNNNIISQVEEYKYLGQIITPTGDLQKEINNRIKSSWGAFKKIESVLTSENISKTTKSNLFNSNVLPSLTYASETWNTTLKSEKKLVTTQRAMERRITNISKRDHIRAEVIREKSGVQDVIEHIYKSKHRWAGHVARLADNRWTSRTTSWFPYGHKKRRGRPQVRWEDPLKAAYGPAWAQIGRQRDRWKRTGSGLHQWRSAR